MGSLDKFCLRWNDFDKNVSKSFASIRDKNQFFDCTLATDDDIEYLDKLRAHKVILSACSEFFRDILTRESLYAHPNPLLYLKGISAKDLMHVLDFMYLGEVNVAKEELDKFLEVADTLKIKGLTQRSDGNSTKKRPAKFPVFPSLSPSDLCKKSKLHSTRTLSTSRNIANPDIFLKTECDPLVPLGALENDNGNIHKEQFDEQDFDEEYDGNDVGTDHHPVCARDQDEEINNIKDSIKSFMNHKRQGKKSSSHSSVEPIANPDEHPDVIPSLPNTKSEHEIHLMTENNPFATKVSEDIEESARGSNDSAIEDTKDETQGSYEVNNSATSPNADDKDVHGNEQKSYKGKHLSETERITLVNLIKTLDNENLLRGNGSLQRAPEIQAKRDGLWNQIVPAFNEICGINCDISKLKRTLVRIKSTPQWKSHSMLNDVGE